MFNNGHDAYLESRVLTADPIELVHLLYQACLEAVREARRHLAEGRIAERAKQINRACQIVIELAVSLDHERGGELSQRLALLYDYMQRRLVEANLKQSDAPLVDVLGLLGTLAEGWEGIRNTGLDPKAADPKEAGPKPALEKPAPEPVAESLWSEPIASTPWSQPAEETPWSQSAADNSWQPVATSYWSQSVAESPVPEPVAATPWSQPEADVQPAAANPWAQVAVDHFAPEPAAPSPWLQPEASSPWAQPLTEDVAYAVQGWSLQG